MQAHPLGARAARIGQVQDKHPGLVVARTGLGATRVVALQIGEQLPRIC
jgi:hydrogenase expression/formation protein HypE